LARGYLALVLPLNGAELEVGCFSTDIWPRWGWGYKDDYIQKLNNDGIFLLVLVLLSN